ncbi:MAG: hypothetical protein ACI8P3_004034 [Saprospiraceae bacterium]
MNRNIAFLELKYGNIYGGYPNFYAIKEVCLLYFEADTNRVFIETFNNTTDLDMVSVYSKVDELGNTKERVREVVNMRTNRSRPYNEEYQLGEMDLDREFAKLRNTKRFLKNFFMKVLRKYQFQDMVTFDGRRDVFLCEKAGVDFRRYYIHDLQKDITKDTNYLFSLNKLAKVIGFNFDGGYLRSNNLQYRLHPIASDQILPKSAAYDAARLLMIHQEFRTKNDDFMMKAALLLNKIEIAKKV